MKKLLVLTIIFAVSFSMYAEYVSSSFEKLPVTFIAESGSVVKKGEPLFKLSGDVQKMQIERKRLKIKNALTDLENKTDDYNRAKILLSKKAISIENYENIVLDYYKSSISLDLLNQELKQLEIDLSGYVVTAPYDCKVIDQEICTNSGVDYGTYVVEIKPAGVNKNLEDNVSGGTNTSAKQLTAVLSGETITFLPEEGSIVKKGDLIVKYDTAVIDLAVKVLKAQLKEAEECLRDAKSDCERAKKLFSENLMSKSDFSDTCLLYNKCKIVVDIFKLDIKIEEYKIKNYYSVYAPYDLKVIKNILSVNSGVKVARPILEVQKI